MSEESMNCCLTGCQKNLTHNRMIEIAETELKLNSCVLTYKCNKLHTKHQKFFCLFYLFSRTLIKTSFRILDGERDKYRDRETERQRDRETERQRDRETERQRDREKDSENDNRTAKKKEKEREIWKD